MSINANLEKKINTMPENLKEIAMQILNEVERGKKANKQIEEMILNEITEIIVEEDE